MDKIFKASISPAGITTIAGTSFAGFSLSIDIDHENPGLDSSNANYASNINIFYQRFLVLSHYFTAIDGLQVSLAVHTANGIVKPTVALSNDEFWKENCTAAGLDSVRENLWQNLFTAPKAKLRPVILANTPLAAGQPIESLNGNRPLEKNVTVGDIGRLYEANTLYNAIGDNLNKALISSLIDPKRIASRLAAISSQPSQLQATLAQGTLAADKFKEVNQAKQLAFIAANGGDLALSDDMDLKAIHEQVTRNYIDANIDLDEIFTIFSQLSHHPVLMRLFGLTIDFYLPLSQVTGWGDTFSLTVTSLTVPGFFAANEWSFLTTNFEKVVISVPLKPIKYAFLPVAKDKTLFHHSILDDNDAYLLNHDPVAQEQKLAAAAEKISQGFNDVIGEVHDSFTRGIIYHHRRLVDIIKPLDVGADGLFDEHLSMGTRVVVKNRYDHNGKWVSLTKRGTQLYDAGNAKIYDCGLSESCIHFDQVGNHMDPATAKIDQKTSDALFEYKGENLTLNTVFSRETKISKTENDAQQQDNPPDQSTYNAQLRMNQFLDIDYYPFDKKVREGIAVDAVKLRYCLPDGNNEARSLASLRFGQTYQFLVYNQYKNGWALPMTVPKDCEQATLDELWNFTKPALKNPSLKFRRLENAKPVILFSNQPIGKAQQESATDLTGKDSLTHLVLRNTLPTSEVFRHVLPDRIALEHAFWAGLLSQMSREERHLWKCRYNYSEELQPWQTSPNDLDCTTDAGGTKMKDYYPGKLIKPEEVVYIPDPLIDGFTIHLYWDENCTEQYLVAYGNEALFQKTNEYTVSSYGFSLMQKNTPGGDSAVVTVSNTDRHAIVYLKPGMKAFAKIYNHVADAGRRDRLGHDYWLNQLHRGASAINFTDFKSLDDDPKSQALVVELTNANCEPLFIPEIWQFGSAGYENDTDNTQNLSYIQKWIDETVALLQLPDYPCTDRYHYLLDAHKQGRFQVGRNILAVRPGANGDPMVTVPGSSSLTFNLVCRFERLDAIAVNSFLPESTPTGQLELWMRKEEFVDDTDQYVLSKKDALNHFPDEPVYPLNHQKNETYHDYKVTWSDDVLAQLKTRLDPQTLADYRQHYLPHPTNDPFQDTISQLTATYDTKTTKFELREYQLIDTSKYRGYYTDKKEGDVSEYQLRSEPYPVLLLGNKQPDKPAVAYMVTTIQRTAGLKDKKVNTTQQGNIVTVYLNRGRLSSGRDERVGVLVNNTNDYSNLYIANGTISKTGKDVQSDQLAPESQFIRYDKTDEQLQDICIPPLAKNLYDARYDEDLSIISYLPRFDTDKQLWKFEIEFRVQAPNNKHLYNPFINLGLIHFQPFALDHNIDGDDLRLEKNCRMSLADTTTFCYLLPKRSLTATFHKACLFEKWGTAEVTIACHASSLNYYQSKKAPKYRTNFIVCVEGSADGHLWFPVMSQTTGSDWQLMHPMLDYTKITDELSSSLSLRFLKDSNPNIVNNRNAPEDHSIRYHKFRLRMIEVEWFKNETWDELAARHQNLLLTDILDVEDLRVRYVELIY